MDISARAISLPDRPQRAIWVTSVRMRRKDRTSISSHPLATSGVRPIGLHHCLLLVSGDAMVAAIGAGELHRRKHYRLIKFGTSTAIALASKLSRTMHDRIVRFECTADVGRSTAALSAYTGPCEALFDDKVGMIEPEARGPPSDPRKTVAWSVTFTSCANANITSCAGASCHDSALSVLHPGL
jgi:hypothetical protein